MDFIGFLIVAFVVLNLIMKASGKKKGAKPGQAANPPAAQAPAQRPAAPAPRPIVAPTVAPRVQPMVRPHGQPQGHCVHGTNSAGKPASAPEGVSAMQPSRLVREDLGALRQKQNPNPALEAVQQPRAQDQAYEIKRAAGSGAGLRAQDLRRAMVLKEVLDRPVSRRRGVRA